MDKPLVSVIIPAFNAEGTIRQTLESVSAQTYRAIEVIVVDDGSSDRTTAIVDEFTANDSRFQLVRQANAGVGAARNTGIGQARGKYIAPLDADDLWMPEKVEKQVAGMEEFGDKTGLVYCWSTLINEKNQLIERSPPCRLAGRLRHAMVLANLLGNASVPLFRASALKTVGVYLTRVEQGGFQGCEDWDLALRIAELFPVQVVPEYLVAYRQNGTSMSLNVEGMAGSFAVFIRRAQQRNSDLPAAAFRWSGGYFYLYIADKCFAWRDYNRCIRYLKQTVSSNPVLFLKAGIYKTALRSLFYLTIRPARKTGLRRIKKKRKLLSFVNIFYWYFEGIRWSAAAEDGAN
jgi:glycosyltransferase involved in cell wall biosynthesis